MVRRHAWILFNAREIPSEYLHCVHYVQDGKQHVYVYLFNLFSIYKSKSASNASSENVYNDE